MTKPAEPDLMLLTAYRSGELSAAERQDLEERLMSNSDLRAELARLDQSLDRLRSLPRQRARAGFAQRVMQNVRHEEQRERERARTIRFASLAAAAAVVIVLAAALLQRDGSGTGRPASPAQPAAPDAAPLIAQSDPAARLAREWLARQQRDDGSWDVTAHAGRPQVGTGVDGLALLALAGDTASYGAAIEKAAAHLATRQDAATGRLGPSSQVTMHNHGLATLALLTSLRARNDADIRRAADAAVLYIIGRQTKTGGWSDSGATEARPDLITTGWQVLALDEARRQGVPGLTPCLERAITYVRNQLDGRGRAAYDGSTARPSSRGASAVAAACLLLGTEQDAALGRTVLAEALRSPVGMPNEERVDPYLTFFLQRAAQTNRDQRAQRLLEVPRQLLAARQVAAGEDAGMLPHEVIPWGNVGGRVYTTAMLAASAGAM